MFRLLQSCRKLNFTEKSISPSFFDSKVVFDFYQFCLFICVFRGYHHLKMLHFSYKTPVIYNSLELAPIISKICVIKISINLQNPSTVQKKTCKSDEYKLHPNLIDENCYGTMYFINIFHVEQLYRGK